MSGTIDTSAGPITPPRLSSSLLVRLMDAPRATLATERASVLVQSSPTAGLLNVGRVIDETSETSMRMYSYCVNRPSLSMVSRSVSARDIERLKASDSISDFNDLDDADICHGLVRGCMPLVSLPGSVHEHVKAVVVTISDVVDVIVVVVREPANGFSGETSLASLSSSWVDRRILYSEYQLARKQGLVAAAGDKLGALSDSYADTIPLRVLASEDLTIRIREIVVVNDRGWFFASKSAVVSFLDRACSLRDAHDSVDRGELLEPDTSHTYDSQCDLLVPTSSLSAARILRTDGMYGRQEVRTSDIRRGVLYADVHMVSEVYVDAYELRSITADDVAVFGTELFLAAEQDGVIMFQKDRTPIDSLFLSRCVGYDARMVNGTWDVNVIMSCSRNGHGSPSSWSERRIAYLRYAVAALSAGSRGGVSVVASRDGAIAALDRFYSGFAPIAQLATTHLASPLVIRECLIRVNSDWDYSYAQVNSLLADLRLLSDAHGRWVTA